MFLNSQREKPLSAGGGDDVGDLGGAGELDGRDGDKAICIGGHRRNCGIVHRRYGAAPSVWTGYRLCIDRLVNFYDGRCDWMRCGVGDSEDDWQESATGRDGLA